MTSIEQLFTAIGGEFVSPYTIVAQKAKAVDAYLFDWDGVFNNGIKHDETGSPFSEIEAMGINLVRFGHWLRTGRFPLTMIITGENNPAAIKLATREHFDAVYFKFKNKKEALAHLTSTHHIHPEKVAFAFDDVLDLPVTLWAGLRLMIRRTASPMLAHFVKSRGYCEYMTGHTGATHAVREICELLLAVNGNFDEVVEKRLAFDDDYTQYINLRNELPTKIFAWENNAVREL